MFRPNSKETELSKGQRRDVLLWRKGRLDNFKLGWLSLKGGEMLGHVTKRLQQGMFLLMLKQHQL